MPAAFDTDVAVVGAGVVGLAAAATLAERGLDAWVLEREAGPGRGITARNSEVIHAGLYYPPGSLKAVTCVQGRRLLYAYCASRGVPFRRLGKLVVATNQDEIPALDGIWQRAHDNGVEGLSRLSAPQMARLEPAVRAAEAILSTETGIVDAHAVVKALEADLRGRGGVVAYRCEVVGVEPLDPGFRLRVRSTRGEEELTARLLVNAAGLFADRVAALAGVPGYRLHWCKGDYFAASGRSGRLVSRLVYPVPAPGLAGLGVHVTLDLGGRMRLGPDVTYLTERRERYDVDPTRGSRFAQAARRYLPDLDPADLAPDTSGIRPKLQGPGSPFADFVIREETAAGAPGLVNLVGIESPGLTASLAIARRVADLALNI